jgi:hypothetical protein
MKDKQDYIRDLEEIRLMMERSSKFLTLSGWAGIMAGIYALSGAYIAYAVFRFNPNKITYNSGDLPANLTIVLLLAILVLVLALVTAIFLSRNKALKKDESIWNAASKQLLLNMAVPLAAGGIFILELISKNLIGLIMPLMLLFYGLALYSAGKFTYTEVKILGLIQIGLGLISVFFIYYSLILWAAGFGLIHITYGIYMYFRYEQ